MSAELTALSGSGSTCFPGGDLLAPLGWRQGIPIGNLTSQFLANLSLDDRSGPEGELVDPIFENHDIAAR